MHTHTHVSGGGRREAQFKVRWGTHSVCGLCFLVHVSGSLVRRTRCSAKLLLMNWGLTNEVCSNQTSGHCNRKREVVRKQKRNKHVMIMLYTTMQCHSTLEVWIAGQHIKMGGPQCAGGVIRRRSLLPESCPPDPKKQSNEKRTVNRGLAQHSRRQVL